MDRKTLKTRSLSLLLCAVMIVSMIPTWAFADTGSGSGGSSGSATGTGSTPQIGTYTQGTVPKLAVGVYDLDGDGVNDDAYEIATAAQLEWFAQHVNSGNGDVNAVLVADIDLDGVTHTPIGVKGSAFRGFFEGRGYTVSNMIFTTAQNGYGNGNLTYNYQGLFGTTVGATVRNFTVDGEITLATNGQNYVGGAVGHAYGGSKIEYVISYVNIVDGDNTYANVEHIGGVVGCLGATVNSQDSSAIAENCRYYGKIDLGAASCVGGIAGKGMKNSSVLDCFNYGAVKADNTGHIAGVVGSAQTGALVQGCANYGSITAHNHDCVGGIAGYANEDVTIKDCANFGTVTSQKGSSGTNVYLGGILGYVNNASFGGITGCFNFGKITDADDSYKYTGAIIGWLRNADTSKISGNHWYTESSRTAYGSSGKSAEAPTAATIFDRNKVQMTDGWYIVSGTYDVAWNINTTGNVNLVLADDSVLNINASNSIVVFSNSSFTIWAQSEPVYNADGSIDEMSTKTGRLTIPKNSGATAAGIGCEGGSEAGKITINGGIITTHGNYSAGIGGNTSNGIIINGGYVDACGDAGAGIGAGGKDIENCSVDSIIINGGTVKAWGSRGGAGIGACEGAEAGSITINGGNITAGSYGYGAGIGSGWNTKVGTITINAGSVTAEGDHSADIGGSQSGGYDSIVINGGKVTTKGNKDNTGIGAGKEQGTVGSITINGGTVNATGGTSDTTDCVVGIGAAYTSAPQRITINGGNVTARSLNWGAGIGGGRSNYVSADITINGGIINATGNDFVAIGYAGNTDTTATPAVLRITGGSITANASLGIGFYARNTNDRIEITGFDEMVISADSGNTALTGNFTIADDIKFRAATGDTLETLTPYNFGEARRYISVASAIRLVKCTDHTQSQIVAPKDNDVHSVHCFWCGESYDEPHVYDDEGICECYGIKEKYLDYDVATGQFIRKSHVGATPIESSTGKSIINLYEGWYIVSGDVVMKRTQNRLVEVMIHGDVHLILADGSSLSIEGAIRVLDDDDDPTNGSPNNLTIYAQSQITVDENGEPDLAATAAGRLNVNASDQDAGIGASFSDTDHSSGAITINGGVISAAAGAGAGIGGGPKGSTNVTINGGAITATSITGAGIGAGEMGIHSIVTIRGGYINAASWSDAFAGAGIGGARGTTTSIVNISGGVINATGGKNGAGIGSARETKNCTINITGGTITAQGGENAAGIGDGFSSEKLSITISNATVNATGGKDGAGIGGGENYSSTVRDIDITINSGTVTAQGGSWGEGIGGGYNRSGEGSTLDIKITGGDIDATAGERGTGIGSHYLDIKTLLTIDIAGGNVKAVGNLEGAGIGGAIQSSTNVGANITIKNATLNVESGLMGGAGIGGAYNGGCGIINISDSTVMINHNSTGAGIGEGQGSKHGTAGSIDITNSNVSMRLFSSYRTGIGSGRKSGEDSSIEHIKLTGSTVTIYSNSDYNTGIGLGYESAGSIGSIEITGGRTMMDSQMAIGIGAGRNSTGSVGDIIIDPDPTTGNVYVSAIVGSGDYAFGKSSSSTATVGDIKIGGGTVFGVGRISAFSFVPVLNDKVEFNVYAGTYGNINLKTPPIDDTLYTTNRAIRLEQTGSPEYVTVDIAWNSMEFTYTDKVWDPTTHSYSKYGWDVDQTNPGRIWIVNVGTTKISYTATVNMTIEGVSGTITNSKGTLDVGYNEFMLLTLQGKPTTALNGTQIGTVTISISRAE